MRRLFLFGIIALVVLSSKTPDDFEEVKAKVVAELLKTPIDDSRVAGIINKMEGDGSFSGINYEDLSRTAGFPHRHHTSNLVYLAKAYQNTESDYHRQPELMDIITRGYRYWVERDFFGDNWHNNQISTPTNLVDLMLLIGDELPEDLVQLGQPIIGRAHMEASGARPSGDRIVIAGILAKNLLFIQDKEGFEEVIRLIEGEVKFSTGSRGMQHDYSFHHRVDRVNNTTSYGYTKYANAFGEWSYYVANTRYALSVDRINHLVDYYLDGIFRQQVYGVYDDISVKNRSITHKAVFAPRPTLEIERLLLSTDYRKEELEAIIRLRKGEDASAPSFAKFFWQTEHFVVQRPDYYTTVRMFSTRNRNMEVPYNGPGKPTHHRADGTNYLMLRGDEYHNIWPVYDWQKISGATILQKPALPPPSEIQKDGLTDFVGAVTDGMFGAAAFDFRSPHDNVQARKAWFFFDEEYLCLGSGIQADRSLPVFSTVNQALMRSDVTISQDGESRILQRGARPLENVDWVHHDRVGYLFPSRATVNVSNRAQTGRWSDITDEKNISRELVSEDVFSLWFDHGEQPDAASYSYIVVPNIAVNELDSAEGPNRGIRILANTSDVQAAIHDEIGICQVAFYRAGEVDCSTEVTLKSDSQGMVMLKMDGERVVDMSVSDPSRKLSRMALTLSGEHVPVESNYPAIRDAETNTTLLLIDLPQGVYAGKPVTITM